MNFQKSEGTPGVPIKSFGRDGLKIGAHFYLSRPARLLQNPKCSKLPGYPQDSFVTSPQFQNSLLL